VTAALTFGGDFDKLVTNVRKQIMGEIMNTYIRKILLASISVGALALGTQDVLAATETQTARIQATEIQATETQTTETQTEEVELQLSAPTLIRLEASAYNKVDIAWSEVENAVFYRVYRSETKTGGYKRIKSVYGTSYTATASTGVSYYYKIMPMAYDAQGKLVKGKCSAARAVKAQLETPSGLSLANGGNNSLIVSWSAVEDADSYAVYRRASSESSYKAVKKVSGSTTWTDTTVEAGTKYYYKVSAGKTLGGKTVYGAKTAAKAKWTKSEAPSDLTAVQDGSGDVSLSWTASRSASSYKLYRAQSGSSYTLLATGITGTSYLDSGLTLGETYSYRLVAVHGSLVSDMGPAATIKLGSIKTNTRTLYLGPGVQAALTATSELDGTLQWVSEDPAVAKVSADGVVTGVAQGTTTINAVIDGVTASVAVTVTDASVNGIDVSKWQQDIDWSVVKASGIKFAMLRLTYGTSKDIQFENYYSGASAQGIKVGVYCYTRATNVDEGIAEAEHLVELLDGRELAYPVALDLEDQLQIKNMNKAARTELILEYKRIIEAAGYDFVVYANLNWLNNYIDQTKLADENVDIWIARYRSQSLGYGYEGGGNVRIWQYSSTGQVDGILDAFGRYINVDLDVCYEDY
jgi:GH25 family lysozyme M1 (1,4-beta-N-acetylmuramidase)/fibronectin type 3 domain-containing protein